MTEVITLSELVAKIRCLRSGKKFLMDFLNECTVEDAIIIPKGATRRDVFNLLNEIAGEISLNQPTFLNHTDEERAAYWNEKYVKGE